MMMTSKLLEYLDTLFPDPKCELLYATDYQLLMAVVLSAQSTDKRVNSVTPIIFSKYPSLEDLANAPVEESTPSEPKATDAQPSELLNT